MSSGVESILRSVRSDDTESGVDRATQMLYNLIIDTRLYLAIISAMEVLVVSVLLEYPLTIAPIIFGLLTFSVYVNDQIIDAESKTIESDRAREFIQANKDELYVFGAVSYGMALSLAAIGGVLAFAITLVPGLAWAAYASNAMSTLTSKVNTDFGVVQEVFLVNTTLVAGAWTATLLLLPAGFVGEKLTVDHILVAAYFFIRVWVNTETSNIPDAEADQKAGVSTLPTKLGVNQTRQVLYLLNFGTIGILALAMLQGQLQQLYAVSLAAGAVYSLGVVAYSRHHRQTGLTQIAEYEFVVVFGVFAIITVVEGISVKVITGRLIPVTGGILLLLAIGIGAAAALIAWQERPEPGALPLAAILTGGVIWAVTLFLEFRIDNLAAMRVLSNLGWIGAVIIPVGWVLLVLEYTGRTRWIQVRYVLSLSIIPALTVFLALTSSFNTLLYRRTAVATIDGVRYLVRSPGPWFWVITGFTYLAGAVGVWLLIQQVRANSLTSRWQGTILIFGTLIPWIINALFIADLLPVAGVDPTPLAFTITGVAYLGAMTRFELLGGSPTPNRSAPDIAFNQMELAAVVIDRNNFIVQANESASELFGIQEGQLLGTDITDVIPSAQKLITETENKKQSTVEVDGRMFETNLTSVKDPYGRTVSQIITLSDISSYIRQQQRLEVINRSFRHNLITKLQLLAGLDTETGTAELQTSKIDVIRDIEHLSERVRDVIEVFELERSSEMLPLRRIVHAEVQNLEDSYPDANINLSVANAVTQSDVDEAVMYVVSNILENAVEHNTNPNPEVSVTVDLEGERIVIVVADNGPGIDASQLEVIRHGEETDLRHLDGLGLWLAVWGTDIIGGDISFEDNDPTGTIVTITIPAD